MAGAIKEILIGIDFIEFLLGVTMQDLVIIKFGGGLITTKDEMCSARIAVISALANEVATLIKDKKRVIIVHGAGSFGHLKAKRWRLHEGRVNSGLPVNDLISSQDEAVETVRQDMLNLSELVATELENIGLKSLSHPPHQWATEIGPNFSGDLSRFATEPGLVHITFGDVVSCQGEPEFGILSGDDICYRLAIELNATHMIFAMGGADGVLSAPPSDDSASLISTWYPGVKYKGVHRSEIDVTGGIHLKLQRAAAISESVTNVWIINGEYPERIVEIVNSGKTLGTRILSKSP
jgi:isopentenyl phosphate kinase